MRRLLATALLLLAPFAAGSTLPDVRVAVLEFGTVNWELDVIRRHQLDRKYGFRLQRVELVSPAAAAVSLQAGASDMIVADWLWVARQFHQGRHYRYHPYSTAVGDLLVPPESTLTSPAQLEGHSLGVAGGPEDKSWLLFRAWIERQTGDDLADRVTPQFGSPPLLNALAEQGRIDAVLTYWHFAAGLKARGYRSLASMDEVLAGLDVETPLPMLGWVFEREWGSANPDLVNRFLAASLEAKQLMLSSDAEWQALRQRMRTGDDEALFSELRDGFRRGIPRSPGADYTQRILRVSGIMARHRQLASDHSGVAAIPRDIFWRFLPPEFAVASHEP